MPVLVIVLVVLAALLLLATLPARLRRGNERGETAVPPHEGAPSTLGGTDRPLEPSGINPTDPGFLD